MKILCLQLARFGDIYQTWPTLNALRHKYASADIHVLVRERFFDATIGLRSVDKVVVLPTEKIIEPILRERSNLIESQNQLDEIINNLKAEQYDFIINLSFSPFSSYLVDCISAPNTVISGYTRHKDGFLNIPDDASSYFYAQVGIDRSNRIHLSDLFALIAGVELCELDFSAPDFSALDLANTFNLPSDYIILHTGASDVRKNCTPKIWQRIIESILNLYSGTIVLVGSNGEEFLIEESSRTDRIINCIGKTKLPEVFSILKKARAVIGCDSVLMHMSSLVNAPSLNISFPTVRFWETGPRSAISRILWFESIEAVDVERVADELIRILENHSANPLCIERVEDSGVLYRLNGNFEDDFSWQLTRAIYMNADFPTSSRPHISSGIEKILELTHLAFEQIKNIEKSKSLEISLSILNEVDHLIAAVGDLVPEISPLVRWFQCEKTRIGPADFSTILNITKDLFFKLKDICEIYAIKRTFDSSPDRRELNWKL